MNDDLERARPDGPRRRSRERGVSRSLFVSRRRQYGILLPYHAKDEKQQALIGKQQTGNQPWASINEARTRTGKKPLDTNKFPFADAPVINTKDGPLPMSIWQTRVSAEDNQPDQTSVTSD